MDKHLHEGTALRLKIKELVLDFMKNNDDCQPNALGVACAEIFRDCGLNWGDLPTKPGNQVYWVHALLEQCEKEGLVFRDPINKKYRIK